MPNGTVPSIIKTALISLTIVTATLIFSLVYLNHLHDQENEAAAATFQQDQKRIQVFREKFQAKRVELEKTVREFSSYRQQTQGEIQQLKTDITTAQTTLAATQQQLTETSAKLKTVESQKDELSVTLERMQKDIGNYNAQIADLRVKFQTETKEKEFMLAQVKDLEAKRDELQKKWNDLVALRSQVRTLVTAEHVHQREQLAGHRGFWGVYQNTGLRNFKTYADLKTEKTAGTTTIEVYREGTNPAPKTVPPSQQPQPLK